MAPRSVSGRRFLDRGICLMNCIRGAFTSKLKLGLWINPGSNFGRGMGEIIVEASTEGSYERKYTASTGAHHHARFAPGLLITSTWSEGQGG